MNDRSDVYAYGMLLYEIFSGNVRAFIPSSRLSCTPVSQISMCEIYLEEACQVKWCCAAYVLASAGVCDPQAPWAQTFPQQIKALVLAQKRPPMPADAKHGMPGLIQVHTRPHLSPRTRRTQ